MNPGFETGPPKSEVHDNCLQRKANFFSMPQEQGPASMTENFTLYQKTFKRTFGGEGVKQKSSIHVDTQNIYFTILSTGSQ